MYFSHIMVSIVEFYSNIILVRVAHVFLYRGLEGKYPHWLLKKPLNSGKIWNNLEQFIYLQLK